MKVVKRVAYKTSDGHEFLNKEAAEQHETDITVINLYEKLKDIKFFACLGELMGWNKDPDIPNFQYYEYKTWYSTHSEGGDWAGVSSYVDRNNNLVFTSEASWNQEKETLMVLPLSWNDLSLDKLNLVAHAYINFREAKLIDEQKAKSKQKEIEQSIEYQVITKFKYFTKEQRDWVVENREKIVNILEQM